MKLIRYIIAIASVCTLCLFSEAYVSAEETVNDILIDETEPTDEQAAGEMPENTCQESSPENDDILIQGEDGRLYCVSDEIAPGLAEIDGETYLIAYNGAVKTGWYTENGIRMFFDTETGIKTDGWISYMGETYYSDPQYGKLSGKQLIDDKLYFFDDKGRLRTGWIEEDDAKYYAAETGEICTGSCVIDGVQYLFSQSGKYESGWQTVGGKRLFFDYDTKKPLYGWIRYNGYIYYADRSEGKYSGDRTVDGTIYRFSEKGFLMTGLQKFSDGTRLYSSEGKLAVGLEAFEGDIYYFNKNGLMQTGFQTIGSNRYYFGSSGKMKTGFAEIKGKKYYFNPNGVMQVGWLEKGSNKYYFDKNGVMTSGFAKIGQNTYYFGSDGTMKTGWQTIGSNKYYFGKKGAMTTGWQKINGKRYFFDKNGVLKPNYPKVFVGVGHGGYDPGAIGYIVEKEYTLKTAEVVADILRAEGVEFMLSRDADIDTTMESKLALCNKYDPDLIVDIHFNAAGGQGFEVYHSMHGGMSLTLAQIINSEVSKIMKSNGCKTFIRNGVDRFTIIRETHAPSVLLEGGYVDDWNDAQFIMAHYKDLAKAYAAGILKALELIIG